MASSDTARTPVPDRALLEDVIEWDVVNWGRAFAYLTTCIRFDLADCRVLELGARRGGLSLYFALQGSRVLCSDLTGPSEDAKQLHGRYGVAHHVCSVGLDATQLGLASESVDLVVFKSLLGGIARDGLPERQEEAVAEMWRVLRPGGGCWSSWRALRGHWCTVY